MAYTPILMDKDASWIAIGAVWVTSFMGFYCCAIGFEGFFRASCWSRTAALRGCRGTSLLR